MAPKQRQVRIEQRGALAAIQALEQRSDEELSKTLAALRPYASMLVIASGDEYIEEMLAALRA